MKISLFEIFKIYFIIGLQLIGGGYVILPLLKKYLVEDKKWVKEEQLIDWLSLSQCLPGIIALNISVFSGYSLRKIKGAITAIFGLLLPSFLIILSIATGLSNFQDNKFIQDAFFGIRLSIIVLIFSMIYDIYKKAIITKFSNFLFIFILILILSTNLSPTILIIISILIALIKNMGVKNV